MSAPVPLALRLGLRLLGLLRWLVPAARRRSWEREWRAELMASAGRPDLLRQAAGALPDAVWLRRQFTLDADLAHDLRHSLRGLRRRPGFAAVAACVLALGLGAAGALFALADALLWQPLPFAQVDRVMTVWQSRADAPGTLEEVAPGNFLDWRAGAPAFERLAAADPFSYDYYGGVEPEVLFALRVTEGFFDALGVRPALGRAFRAEDHRPGGARVALIAHSLWQRRFGGDPAIVGRGLPLEDTTYTVVGVLPADFDAGLLPSARRRELWTPYVFGNHEAQTRATGWWAVVGRLRPGVEPAVAQAQLDAIAADLGRRLPRTNAGVGVRLRPLADHVRGELRQALLLLLGGALLLLCAAWINVAGLLVARGLEREREVAIRTALGAGRGRLARQLVAEALLLSGAATAVAAPLAQFLVEAAVRLAPVHVPRLDAVSFGPRAVLALAVAALASAVLCAAPGALRLFAPQRALKALRGAARNGSGPSQPLWRTLVVAEVAAACVLLAGAGLLARGVGALLAVDPGFRPRQVVALQVFAWDRRSTPAARQQFFDHSLERLRALPGVEAAGAVSRMPFIEANIGMRASVSTTPESAVETDRSRLVYTSLATPGYFETMGVRLLAGRTFLEQDGRDGRPVVIVNRTLARRLWPQVGPLGQPLHLNFQGRPLAAAVIGVVEDVLHERLDAAAEPELFLPHALIPSGSMTYVVRGAGAASLIEAAKAEVRAVDPQQAFYKTAAMPDLVGRTLAERRFLLVVLAGFAVAALVLAGLGLYGLLSFATARRTSEIGVRRALGADARRIARLVVADALPPLATGVALGLATAAALGGLLASHIYTVAPRDPVTYGGVIAALVVVGLVAVALPARRAIGLDPASALRAD